MSTQPFTFELPSDEPFISLCALDNAAGMTLRVPITDMEEADATEIRKQLVDDAPLIIRSPTYQCRGRISKVRMEGTLLCALVFPTTEIAIRVG